MARSGASPSRKTGGARGSPSALRAIAALPLVLTLCAAAPALEYRHTRLVVAIPEDFPPTYFRDARTGKPAGFAVDLLAEVGEAEGFDVEYVYGKPWEEIHQLVLTGKADLAANMVENEERAKLFAFSRHVETVAVAFVARSTDLSGAPRPGMKVGVMRESTGEDYLAKHPELGVTEVKYDSMTTLLFDLLSNQIDLAVAATPNIMKLAIDSGVEDRLRVLSPPISEGHRVMMLRKDDPELLARIDRGLAKVMATEHYKQTYERWYGHPHSYWTSERVALAAGGAMVAVFLLAAIWRARSLARINAVLRREVGVRLQAEAALRTEVAQHGALLAGVADGVTLVDREFRVLQQNRTSRELQGDIRGQACFRAFARREAVCEGCPVQDTFADGQLHAAEKSVDGQRLLLVTSAAVRDEQGAVVAAVEVVRDITEQRRAQQEQEAERERLAVTLRSIGDAVIVTGVDGRITLLNRVGEQLTGWDQSAAVGLPLHDVLRLVDERTREPFTGLVEKVLATRASVSLDGRLLLRRRDGAELAVQDSAAPILDRSSNVVGVVLVFRDTTAKRRSEEEQQQMERLQSLGLLAGGIAHDFNNLLMSILGNISLARFGQPLCDEARIALEDAEGASKRATGLTRQLLTFAKGGDPIRKAASLVEVIRESAAFTLSGASVAFDLRAAEGLWAVDADAGQLNQVFNNLILNAVQAMPRGGTITCRLGNVELPAGQVASLPAGRFVRVEVEDTGVGIPADVLKHVFDPYFTTKPNGSGLGLASTYSILRRHDGHISVASRVNSGTTFTLHLPAATGEPAKPAPEKRLARGRRVILASAWGRLLL